MDNSAGQAYAPSMDNDEIDLGELIDSLLEGKWLIIICTALAGFIGVLVAMLSTPIYEADALVQLESDNSTSMSALFGEMGDVLSAGSEATAEIELIKSRLVLGRTVEQLNLHTQVQPQTFPLIGRGLARLARADFGPAKAVLALIPNQYAHGDESIGIGRFEVEASYYNLPFTIVADDSPGEFLLLLEEEGVALKGMVGQTMRHPELKIVIQVQSLDAPSGREFAITRLDPLRSVELLRESLSVSEKGKDSGIVALRYIHPEPEHAEKVLNTVANNYLRQNVERKGEEAEQTLEYLRQQLPALREKLEISEAQLNQYRTSQGSADLMAETQLLLQQSAELEALRLGLAQEREQLLQRYQPTHPSVQALDAQVRDVQNNVDQLDKRIANLPETQQKLLRLTRDVQVNTELYTSLLNSSQQLEVAKAGTVGSVRIVDYAGQPRRPVKPKKALILALSVLLGGVLGVMLVFFKRALFGTIDDPQQFEQQFGLPVYANIPVSKQNRTIMTKLMGTKGMKTLDAGADGDPALEAVKSLRTALYFGLHEARNKIVLITGPRPGLGKSFVSANLASTLAASGKQVVLIDADMRRGTIHTYMGTKRGPGLSDVLSERVSLSDVMQNSARDGLRVIPSGTIPPNPSELLGSVAMTQMLDTLAEENDVIVIDSPPNLAVADSSILAQIAGTSLMVLKADTHPAREVVESIKRLKLVGAELRGVVFNMVRQQSRRYGYGRYNNYYTYGAR